MNRKMTVTAQALRAWLGIPPPWNISLGLPAGARVDGEEDVILYVDVEIPTASAPDTVTGREADAKALRCACRRPGPGNGDSKCRAPFRAVCQCECHAEARP